MKIKRITVRQDANGKWTGTTSDGENVFIPESAKTRLEVFEFLGQPHEGFIYQIDFAK